MFNTLHFIWNHPISSANRLAAFSRYFRWQIGTRILNGPVVIQFVEKSQLVCERSMSGATGNLYCGLHEFGDMGFLLHFLRPEDEFADIGANIGSFTILASGVVGAKTVSLEPVPSTFNRMKRNIRLNDIEDRVNAHCVAAGAEEGSILFSIDQDCVNQVVSESYEGQSMRVPVVPMDELLKGKSPTLWKVDVEGFEHEVLKGATGSLRNSSLNAVLLEADSEEIRGVMTQAGFARASYEPISRQLSLVEPNQKGTGLNTNNNLWIRNFETVDERVRTGRQFTVYGKSF
jgi:FkbM family methyltransferase